MEKRVKIKYSFSQIIIIKTRLGFEPIVNPDIKSVIFFHRFDQILRKRINLLFYCIKGLIKVNVFN